MAQRLEMSLQLNPFSAGIVFKRQILTSKVDTRANIGIQMKRKDDDL